MPSDTSRDQAARDVIVIGASAGGVEALTRLVAGLPASLPATLFVVEHFPAAPSRLPEILSRRGPLLAAFARDGEPFYPGHIYAAPPDFHLLLGEGVMRLSHGPRENNFRPAIDVLFRSAARAYGPRVIGVVLSGALFDGVAGLMAVRNAGGTAVIQDPQDAAVDALPRSARDIAGADHLVMTEELGPLLVDLVNQPVPAERSRTMAIDPVDKLSEVQSADMDGQQHGRRRGQISVFNCPECGGSLWQVDERDLVRFRCHVGHIYLGEALLNEQSAALEAALWTAVRTFKEKTILARQLAAEQRRRGQAESADRCEEQARVAENYGELIHQYLLQNTGPGGSPRS